ncbi:hypothetical protein L211DRAFT_854648 [Terfezia boudieri ATCC MYA-4762]|uniref:Uncharacterized protein n=1 Tax=Terfezia boudieri ATCC MYA-4762 TaxID=1051890 RepID=A0A3N4L5U3_9PEZI|nr:hypothetical protein L211DRAFT_854649 [Terfezia boudieri ATCC MYA-4762]RPB17936.1 hypothetical protein L211DRAFT_854648 [Terfezia boudieri ATCC MYA-4762]
MSRSSGLPRTPPGNSRNIRYPDIETRIEEEEVELGQGWEENSEKEDNEEVEEGNLMKTMATPKGYVPSKAKQKEKTDRTPKGRRNPYTPLKESNRTNEKLGEIKILIAEMEKKRNDMLERIQKIVQEKLETIDQRITFLEQDMDNHVNRRNLEPVRTTGLGRHAIHSRHDNEYFGSAVRTHANMRNPRPETSGYLRPYMRGGLNEQQVEEMETEEDNRQERPQEERTRKQGKGARNEMSRNMRGRSEMRKEVVMEPRTEKQETTRTEIEDRVLNGQERRIRMRRRRKGTEKRTKR